MESTQCKWPSKSLRQSTQSQSPSWKILNFDVFVSFKHVIYFFEFLDSIFTNSNPNYPSLLSLDRIGKFYRNYEISRFDLDQKLTLILKLCRKSLDRTVTLPSEIIWVADYEYRVEKLEKKIKCLKLTKTSKFSNFQLGDWIWVLCLRDLEGHLHSVDSILCTVRIQANSFTVPNCQSYSPTFSN